jgi:hypothetical protein
VIVTGIFMYGSQALIRIIQPGMSTKDLTQATQIQLKTFNGAPMKPVYVSGQLFWLTSYKAQVIWLRCLHLALLTRLLEFGTLGRHPLKHVC